MDPFSIFVLVTSLFAGGASYVQARKAAKAAKKAADANRGVLLNKESNVESIPVIYGTRRVGGVRVFVSTEGKVAPSGGYYGYYDPETGEYFTEDGGSAFATPTNEYLYIALVLCEGPVNSISDIYIDDIPASDSRFTGYVTIQSFTGTDDQAASSILRTVNEYWTVDHRLRGVAYLAIRLKYNPDVFSGIPEFTALVQGRKVYDPREVSHDPDDSSTWAFSNNPSLCLMDYLTNERFGKGLPRTAIDEASFIEAANDCDSSVTEYSGGTTGKLFECNAVLSTGETIFDNANRILLGCRGFMPYSQGVYQLRIDKSRSTVMEFDINNIIGGITIRGETKEDKFNRIISKFANPDNNWQTDVAFWPPEGSTEETTFLAEDGGVLLQDEVEFETITNYYQARDLARIFVLRSRNALKCAFQCTSDALQLSVADVVTVTHPTPGWASKPFQVEEIGINTDGTCALSLIEYDSTIYTWEVGTEQSSYPDSYLPNPYLVGPVSNLTITESTFVNSDGTVMVQAEVEWDAPVDGNVVQYELQVKKSADADTEYASVFATTNKYIFTSANSGVNYTVRIRSINSLGVKSDWVYQTALLDGKTDTPTSATSLSLVAGVNNIKLSWSGSADKDIATYKVYRGTSSTFGSATLISSVTAEYYVDQNITAGITYYYWIVTVDTSGNESSEIGPVSGVATTIADGIVDGTIDVAKFAAGIEPVSLVSSVPGTKSTELIYNTSTDKLYKWNGSSYVIVAPEVFSDLGGTIGTSQITDSAITAAKIGAAAVEAGKIASNAVTSSTIADLAITEAKVAASAITTAKIADSAISTGKLADDAATEAKIATSAITATKISDGAIETAKLAAGAVTAAKITAGTITASEIASGTITASNIASGAITTAKLDALAVTADKIAANTITSAKIAASTITSTEIAAGTILAANIASNTITASEIAAGAITTTEIAASTITSGNIASLAITTDKLAANAVTAAKIAANTITAAQIAADTITAGQIAAGAIGATEIAADAVSVGKLISNTSKSYGNFQFEFGTSTSVAGWNGAGILRSAETTSFGVGGLANSSTSASVAGQQAANSSTGWGGIFLNSTILGGTTHRSYAQLANNTTGAIIGNTSYSVQLGNATYAIQTSGDAYVDGDITATGTISPFTGMHDGLIDDTVSPDEGDILVDIDVLIKRDISNTLCEVALSSSDNQVAIGVYSGQRPSGYVPVSASLATPPEIGDNGLPSGSVTYSIDPAYSSCFTGKNIVIINALGEGQINVCGENGDISAGDLIVTSSTAGKGMKQSDDIIRARTVAKARESVTFTGSEIKQIACIYLCG
ncbi:MAG: hypothetical protein ACO23R_02665 [bacterium]